MVDEAFLGGSTSRARRRGGVLVRDAGPWSPSAIDVLLHLESRGVEGVQQVEGSGFDESGNETFRYVDGTLEHPGPMENVVVRPAVFFDLGWTIGRVPEGESLGDFVLYPETPQALRALGSNGWLAVVITNQKGIAYGRRTLAEVDQLRDRITGQLVDEGVTLDGWYVCPHADEDRCVCRKPGVGLFKRAAQELDIELGKSWVVGDLWRDVAAGIAIGARTVQVNRSDRQVVLPPAQWADVVPDDTAPDVLSAVKRILAVDS